jgi:hypothetical protein
MDVRRAADDSIRHRKLKVAASPNSIQLPKKKIGVEKVESMNFCCVHKMSEDNWWQDGGTMIVACSDSLEKRDQALPVNTLEFGVVKTDAHGVPYIEWMNPNDPNDDLGYSVEDSSYRGGGPAAIIGHIDRTNCCCIHKTKSGELFLLSCADDGATVAAPLYIKPLQ